MPASRHRRAFHLLDPHGHRTVHVTVLGPGFGVDRAQSSRALPPRQTIESFTEGIRSVSLTTTGHSEYRAQALSGTQTPALPDVESPILNVITVHNPADDWGNDAFAARLPFLPMQEQMPAYTGFLVVGNKQHANVAKTTFATFRAPIADDSLTPTPGAPPLPAPAPAPGPAPAPPAGPGIPPGAGLGPGFIAGPTLAGRPPTGVTLYRTSTGGTVSKYRYTPPSYVPFYSLQVTLDYTYPAARPTGLPYLGYSNYWASS